MGSVSVVMIDTVSFNVGKPHAYDVSLVGKGRVRARERERERKRERERERETLPLSSIPSNRLPIVTKTAVSGSLQTPQPVSLAFNVIPVSGLTSLIHPFNSDVTIPPSANTHWAIWPVEASSHVKASDRTFGLSAASTKGEWVQMFTP
ncbi:hypothetical protein AOLI_G00285380 [Acnodon oligacanthus]